MNTSGDKPLANCPLMAEVVSLPLGAVDHAQYFVAINNSPILTRESARSSCNGASLDATRPIVFARNDYTYTRLPKATLQDLPFSLVTTKPIVYEGSPFASTRPDAMTSTTTTITYKTVGKLDIAFDVHLPPSAKKVPILLWFHGGGLLQGHRSKLPAHLRRSVSKYTHAFISADYRLAPQVGVQEIYEDVRDSIAFIRDPNGLTKQLGEGVVDPSRLAVSGSSAGGYLAFLAGLYVEPKPNVILPIYPITDPLGYFFTNKQPAPLLDAGKVDLEKQVLDSTVAPFTDRNAKVVANNESDSDRNQMYGYMLDRANLAEMLHLDTKARFPYLDKENDKWRIAKSVKARGLPPTYVVHGDIDRAVGIEQADEVVGVMIGQGLEVKYERLGVDHLFDQVDEKVELEGLYKFMHAHL